MQPAKSKLSVKIDARFDWMDPPENTAEKAIRSQADAKIAQLASKLEQSVGLILIEMAVAKTNS